MSCTCTCHCQLTRLVLYLQVVGGFQVQAVLRPVDWQKSEDALLATLNELGERCAAVINLGLNGGAAQVDTSQALVFDNYGDSLTCGLTVGLQYKFTRLLRCCLD